MVAKWTLLESYLRVADIFVEYTLMHLRRPELDTILSDVLKHVTREDKVR